ncbi:MAG: ParA family protein [Gemmatimonadaceae bacterium]
MDHTELIGIHEIAAWAGVGKSAVANWRTRHPDFPAPITEMAAGPLFARSAVRKWLRARRPSMTSTIAFINLKGGVAKTTTTVVTAQILAHQYRKKVLVIDLDAQTNATVMLVGEDRWKELNDSGHTLAQLFKDALKPEEAAFDLEATLQKDVGAIDEVRGVDLLPSSLDLINLQDELVTMPAGRFRSRRPIDVLHSAIREEVEHYDFVLIDCPPSLGLVTLNGLVFADGYVIPTIPDVLSTYGIDQIVSRVADFAKETHSPVEPLGILATKYQTAQNVHVNQLRRLKAGNIPVFETQIPQGNDMSAAPEFKRVGTLRQKWGYGQSFKAYVAFVDELLAKVTVPAS